MVVWELVAEALAGDVVAALVAALRAVPAPADHRLFDCECDAAYRRAFDTCGRRMQQLSACGADREELSAQFAAIRDELADLWRRAETAAKPARSPR